MRAVDRQRAAERLDAVGQPPQPAAAAGIGAAATVVVDLDPHAIAGACRLTRAREASAYLATFASPSEQTKYAARSASADSCSGSASSSSTGTGERAASASSAPASPPVASSRG